MKAVLAAMALVLGVQASAWQIIDLDDVQTPPGTTPWTKAKVDGLWPSEPILPRKPKKSPYEAMQKMTESQKTQFVAEMKQFVKSAGYSQEQQNAFADMITSTEDGDAVLEVVDQKLINWFYGYVNDGQAVIEDVAKVGGLTDSQCMNGYQICVIVSKSAQRIYAYEYGREIAGVHGEKVSTARRGKVTPNGTFSIGEIAGKNRRSGRYKGAYLGYAMQLNGHIFLHATSPDQYGKLGTPASAGCVRMHLNTAATLNGIMRTVSKSQIRVIIRN